MRFPNSCPFTLFGKISSHVVSDMLERAFLHAYGTPVSIMTDNAMVFPCKQIRGVFSVGNYPHNYSLLSAGFTRGASQSEFEICAVRFFIMHPRSRGIGWISLAFNTAIRDNIKCTTDKLFLGREFKSPLLVRWY
jgi:hypothetical protein